MITIDHVAIIKANPRKLPFQLQNWNKNSPIKGPTNSPNAFADVAKPTYYSLY